MKKIFCPLLMILLIVQPLYSIDLIHNLPEPLTSVNDINYKAKSLEYLEMINPIRLINISFLGPVVENNVLVQAHDFLSISYISIVYSINQNLSLNAAAFIYQRSIIDDSITAGHMMANNITIISDTYLGVRNFFGDIFFLGVGLGVGLYVAIEDNVLSDLIFDRIFFYNEIGVNLRLSSQSFILAFLMLNIGYQIEETPEMLANRSKIVNGSLSILWNYIF